MLTIKRFGLSEFGINPDFSTDTIPVYIELESITLTALQPNYSG